MFIKETKNTNNSHEELLRTALAFGGVVLCFWAGTGWFPVWMAVFLSVDKAMYWYRTRRTAVDSVAVLNTPFHLSSDAEIFDRYQQISLQLLRISQRKHVAYRQLALERLNEVVAACSSMAQGLIVYSETETWRIAYERLLREPVVFSYRSVAIVRRPRYWQDAAGIGSMQLNFQLIEERIVTIERIAVIADELWPKSQDLPVEELRQWIHEQSTHGIWIRLARISDLRNDSQLPRDIGIYGQLAVGTQELADDNLGTRRFTLNFDYNAVHDAELQWEKLRVYSVGHKELLEQFRLND